MTLILDPGSTQVDMDSSPLAVENLEFNLARKRADLISSEASDGVALFDDPMVDMLELVARVRVAQYADRDDAVAQLRRLVKKLDDVEKRRPDGMQLQWTDPGSSVTTSFYALLGELTELPMQVRGADAGWAQRSPLAIVQLTCKPFGYGASVTRTLHDNDPFNRDTLSEGRWRFDTGSGTISVSGGQLVPSSTAEKTAYRPIKTADATATMKIRTGASVASGSHSVVLKRLDSSNFLMANIDATSGLFLFKKDGGAFTSLASTAHTFAINTDYWLRFVIAGNACTVTLYTADPETGAAAVKTVAHTLTAGNATKFGSGVYGNPGWRLIPSGTDCRYDGWLLSSASIRSGEPILDFEVRDTAGDVDAEPVLTVTEKSTQTRRHFEWGLEHEDYSATAPEAPLIDSDQMTALGGSATTRTGAYDPLAAGNSVIRATLGTIPLAICSTGNQGHVGRFRPKVRVYGTSLNQIYVRLSYRVGDGPWGSNPWQLVPIANDFAEVDLGAIDIPELAAGTQRWEGRIEAYSTRDDGTADTLDVDYLIVNPAKRWSKARGPVSIIAPTAFSAVSAFNSESGAITGDSLLVGGTWTGAGDADDFSVSGGVATRTAVSDASTAFTNGRLITASSPTLTNTVVQVQVKVSDAAALGLYGVIARYVSSTSFFVLVIQPGENLFSALKVVSSSQSVLTPFSDVESFGADAYYTITAVVLANGVWLGYLNGHLILTGFDTALATGGSLESGKPGVVDLHSTATACTRTYDNFAAWAPELPVVLNSGRTLEITHERTERYDTTGTYIGEVPENPGSRLWLPPAGDRDLVTRIVTAARRNDVAVEPNSTITDEHEVSLTSRPRYRFPMDS